MKHTYMRADMDQSVSEHILLKVYGRRSRVETVENYEET
jgi:hypothetical protein